MKYLIVVLPGLGDQPLEPLKGKTPLEAAKTPNLDRISSTGRLGLVETLAGKDRAGSEKALLSLLGYDTAGLRVARGPLEAAGIGVSLGPDDLALRMNFISTFNDALADHNAGQIQESEAAALVKMLNLRVGEERIEFHAGLGYRNLLVMRGWADLDFETVPPHEIVRQPVRDFYPYGADASILINILDKAGKELGDHDINRVRVDLGENPANSIWLWGQGRDFSLPPFSTLFPLEGCVVGAVPLVKGIARKIGFDVIDVHGATGGVDTDFAAKVEKALSAMKRFDIVVLHVGAVNEASHEGNPSAKVTAIETVDYRVLGPVLKGLEKVEAWRLMVATDHITSSLESTWVRGPVPVAFCGHEVKGIRRYPFTEANAKKSDLYVEKGHTLLEFFLGVKRLQDTPAGGEEGK